MITMTEPTVNLSSAKARAAERALALVQPGMLLGLGTGTTTRFFIEGLGALVQNGLEVRGVPTSRATAQVARRLGIPVDEEFDGPIDLAVDGADEISPGLDLIKGRGGALLREKVVAASAKRFVVIADEGKLVDRLGVDRLPVEITPFGWRTTARRLERMASSWTLRGGEEAPFQTDNGNLILDLLIEGGIEDPAEMACDLSQVPGLLAHGLFLAMTSAAIVASESGVRVIGEL